MLLNIFSHGLEKKLLFNKLYNNLLNNYQDNSLLLIQNGVYFGAYINKKSLQINNYIYALKDDVIARGLLPTFNKINYIELINYKDFVNFIIKYDKNITW